MPSIRLGDVLIRIFVMIDDWYQVHGIKSLAGKVGKKPLFRGSEVITLILAQDFILC
jgi:hypothetical protein